MVVESMIGRELDTAWGLMIVWYDLIRKTFVVWRARKITRVWGVAFGVKKHVPRRWSCRESVARHDVSSAVGLDCEVAG